jgi:hypothetical protein
MVFIVAVGLVFLAIVFATGIVEAWARYHNWPGYDDRPVRYDRRRTGGRPW